MNEMDKWKFNFSFWPSIQVIVLALGSSGEGETKNRGGERRGQQGAARDTRVQGHRTACADPLYP